VQLRKQRLDTAASFHKTASWDLSRELRWLQWHGEDDRESE
jgi:hypothetical protein